ncbi:SDR family oxidoreductase [Parapedobacter koreensis]|uniref:Enoyl-(Acyl carrier protein) reductase n=1 Tax=Parapedobacter koreensis TaxID=332977 RepID=A0A1H7LQQ2_9SPHI|nr:SDR family oxidoreductase [Parapedobacter koreensis]SEL01209.1 Enoyl-(Acyl carrier protein) reductase [Parapedobacter koreensis]
MAKKTTNEISNVKQESKTYDEKRRDAIKGVALAGLATAFSPAISLAQTVTGNTTVEQQSDPLIDPRTRFANDQPPQRQEVVMKPGSAIVFTNSVTSFLPSEAFMDYSATKGFLSAFTIALGKQVAHRGIRVNGVAPGAVWTPLQIYFGAPDTNVQTLNNITPIGRMGQPVEMAPLYVALAEGTNSFTTSTTWSASGGRV